MSLTLLTNALSILLISQAWKPAVIRGSSFHTSYPKSWQILLLWHQMYADSDRFSLFPLLLSWSKPKLLCVLVTQLCPTLCDPTDCSSPHPHVCGILQARVGCLSLLQVIFLTQALNLGLPHCWKIFTVWTTGEAQATLPGFLEVSYVIYLFPYFTI